jgi:hypothetical protein
MNIPGTVFVKARYVIESRLYTHIMSIVADSDPDREPDPCVFGPPVSAAVIQRYGSGSGSDSRSRSFYHQAKIVIKTLDSYCFVTLLRLFIFVK